MNYQTYDYETDSDAAPWMAGPSSTQMVGAPRNTLTTTTPQPANSSEMVVLGSMLQSVQQTQMQQIYMLREFDSRIARLEQASRPNQAPQTPTYERATWWALWGLLMLVLGGALTVVLVLILMNIQFRT